MLFCLWCLAVFLQEESVIAFVLQIAIFIARVPEVLLKNEIFSKSRKAVAPLPLNSAVFKEGPRGWVPFLLFPVALSPGKINSEWPKEHPEFSGEFGQGAAIPCTPPALPHSGNGSIHHWGLCLPVSVSAYLDPLHYLWVWFWEGCMALELCGGWKRAEQVWWHLEQKAKVLWGNGSFFGKTWCRQSCPRESMYPKFKYMQPFFFFFSFYRLRSWEWVCLAAGQLSLWTCKTMEM